MNLKRALATDNADRTTVFALFSVYLKTIVKLKLISAKRCVKNKTETRENPKPYSAFNKIN